MCDHIKFVLSRDMYKLLTYSGKAAPKFEVDIDTKCK